MWMFIAAFFITAQIWEQLWCPPTGEWVSCSISRQWNINQHKKRNEWSNHEKPWRKVKCLCCVLRSFSHVWLFATPEPVVCQVPQFIGFYRQEYWSGLPFPSPGDLPDPGIEPGSPAWRQSPALQADSLPLKPSGQTTSKTQATCENVHTPSAVWQCSAVSSF